jgi:hypothetical protein
MIGVLIIPLLIVSGYFLVITPIRLFLYWLAILFHVLLLCGSVLKILHLPGADELLMSGFISSVLSGALMIWNGVKSNAKNSKAFKLMLGLCIIIQPVLSTLYVVDEDYTIFRLALYLAFPILLLAAWIIFKKETIHQGERNLVIVILAHAVFAVAAIFNNPYSSFL